MGIHLADQTMAFLCACLLGAVMGLVYDVFRILRVAFPSRPGTVFAQDVLYFLLCAAATFLFLLTAVDGAVRFFLLLGEVIGWVLYHFTLGQLVMGVSKTIISLVKGVLRRIVRYILKPLWSLVYHLVAVLTLPVRFFGALLKKNTRKVKFRLKVDRIVLYNHLIAKKRRGKSAPGTGETEGEDEKG